MRKRSCPSCKRIFEYESLEAWKPYPFCSDACRLADLGAWLDGEYVIMEDVSDNQEALQELLDQYEDENPQ